MIEKISFRSTNEEVIVDDMVEGMLYTPFHTGNIRDVLEYVSRYTTQDGIDILLFRFPLGFAGIDSEYEKTKEGLIPFVACTTFYKVEVIIEY